MTDLTPLGDRSLDYLDDLPEDIEGVRSLLESYSHIPPCEVEPHLRDIRDRGWKVFPYGCIGRWLFLDCVITSSPEYGAIVDRLKSGETLLDAGCAFGYVSRQLATDGAPAANLVGIDLQQGFIDLGYELFRDQQTFAAKFLAGNLLDLDDHTLDGVNGSIDIIHASALFHLFGWDDQVVLGSRLVKFFKPNAANAMVVGRQVGTVYPDDLAIHRSSTESTWYRHNLGTWQQLWDEIGHATGTRWTVSGALREMHPAGAGPRRGPPGRASLNFVITKV